ncbi:MAG: glycosyltransferase family 39 protein [Cyanobacteria bacterium P01_A01_bin.37]
MTPLITSRSLKRWVFWADQRSELLIVAGLIVMSLLLYTWSLGTVSLRDWDEGLVAQVAREIFQAPPDSQTWIYPTLWGQPYFNKPPLVHGLVAIAYRLGGVNEWMARLPGAWLTAASVPLLYGIGRELFIQRLPALLSASVYLVMLPVVRHGRLAMLDGAVLCFFLLLLWCLLRSRRNPYWSLGIGIGFGCLCVSKGVIALLLGAIALLFIIWDSPRLLRSKYLWIGLLLGMIPAIIWYAYQQAEYGQDFWSVHVFSQSLNRVTETVENNSGPPWYYLLELLKYGFPWLVFLPIGLTLAWGDRHYSWAKLTLVWLGGYLAVISVMSTKLPWYVLPMYPAIALVVGQELYRLWETLSGESFKRSPSSRYRWVLSGFFAFLSVVGWVGSFYFGRVENEGELAIMLAALGLTMLTTAVLVWRRDRQFITTLIWGFYVTLLLFVSSNHWVWELGEDYPVRPVAVMMQRALPPDVTVWTSHPLNRPSLNFYSEHRVFPKPRPQLRTHWRQNDAPYLLLDDATLDDMNLKAAQVLGTAEGWTLITKR